MKPIFKFVRTTITGGILFLLPLVLSLMLVGKAHDLLVIISKPLAERLPDILFGLDGSNLVAVALLIVICFFSGLLFRSAMIKRWILSLEDNILSHLPGYRMIKSITADTVGEKVEQGLSTVLIKDDDSWKIGFKIEEADGFCTVFLPDAPRYDSGDVVILPASMVKQVNVPSHVAIKSLKNYGKGSLQWLKQSMT